MCNIKIMQLQYIGVMNLNETSYKMKGMGLIIIKGAKGVVGSNENLYHHSFEKPPLIVFNKLFVHLLNLCLFAHEVGILWIWSPLVLLG